GDHGVVEAGVHMGYARGDVLSFAAARSGGSGLDHFGLSLNRLFLAGNCLGGTLAGAGVGMGALATDRQALAMAQTAITAEIHQALDVHRHLAAQIALDPIVSIDQLAD